MKKSNYMYFTLIFLIIIIMCMFLFNATAQNDLFFDLRSGKDILKYGVDFKDHFSFIPNLVYLYHHWLYDLLIYFIYKLFNYGGLYFFFLLIYILLGISIFKVNLQYSKNKILSLLITFLTLFLTKYAIQTRVQTITYLLFFLELFFLEKLYNNGNKKYIYYLIVISIIILNFHMPLWFFTIILTLPFLCEILIKFLYDKVKFLRKYNIKKIIIEYPKNTKLFLIAILLLILSGFISPYKLEPYTFFTKVIGNNSYLFISEMSKTILIVYKAYLILFIVAIFILYILNTKTKLRDLCLLGGLFIFSLLANRNVIYSFLFYPTILTKIYFENFNIPKFNFKNKIILKLKKIIDYIVKIFKQKIMIITLIIFSIITIIVGINSIDFKKFDFHTKDNYPDKIVNYIKKNLDYKNIKLYTDFNFGSYIAFNDIPIFVDSRAEVYMKKFNGGKDIINDFLKVDNYNDYKKIFNKYKFDYALVYYNSNLYYYLKNDKDFELIYNEDDLYTLFKCNL